MIRAALALALLLPSLALAAEPDPSTVFQWEAPVDAGGAGLARLPLPEAVLTKCGPDLSDLRLYNEAGVEIPYAVEEAPQQTAVRTHRVEIDELSRFREPEHKRWYPWIYVERFTIETPPDGGEHRWEMSIDSRTPSFVRGVQVWQGAPDAGGELLGEGTVFRLKDGSRSRLSIPLPPLPKGVITIQLRGADGGYLEPIVTLTSSWQLGAPDNVAIPLAIVSRTDSASSTSLVLDRPDAVAPRALRITTSTTTFDRPVAVWDEGRGRRDGRIGAGDVWRLDGDKLVQELDVRIRPAVGERLRLEISNGDSPPLAIERIDGLLTQPTLVFDARGAKSITMRFGAERVRRPDYDIVGLLGAGKWLQGEADNPTLFDPRSLHGATLGTIAASPAYSREPALAFASRPGRALDVSLWSHVRSLVVPPSDDHLVLVRLDPPELGKARPDLGDVRIVDAAGNQWPFLRDRTENRTSPVRLAMGARETSKTGETRYPLSSPSGPAQIETLEIQGPAGYFDRAFSLLDGDKNVVTRGRLVREAGDPRPVAIELNGTRADSLVLVITDGDDAALELTEFTAHVRTTDLLAALAPGRYDLLVGNPDSEPGKYELARVASTVYTVRPLPVTPDPLVPNPKKKQVDLRGSGVEKGVMWVAILLAVLLLGAITLKSATGDDAAEDSDQQSESPQA